MKLPEWWTKEFGQKPYAIMDCIKGMKRIPDNSIDLIVTSPPYNVGIEYNVHNDNMPFEEYLSWMYQVFDEMRRNLRSWGRIAINIGDHGRNPCYPTHAFFGVQLHKIGMICRGMIIWDKRNCLSNTAWGSWQSPSNPALRSRSEYIWIFCKEKMNNPPEGRITDITDKEFIKYTMETWNITPETDDVKHPSPFPEDIPNRIIKLYTYKGDIVLDPFLGSGTTLLSCKKRDRIGLGFEIDHKYEPLIISRLASYQSSRSVFEFDKRKNVLEFK